MTPSELSAIRVECALARGWTEIELFQPSHEYMEQQQRPFWRGMHPDNMGLWMELPDYPIDNNAALTLAKALADEGWDMTHKRAASQPEHLVYFEKGCGMTYEHHYATAPTFALALSMAFLAVHRSKKA